MHNENWYKTVFYTVFVSGVTQAKNLLEYLSIWGAFTHKYQGLFFGFSGNTHAHNPKNEHTDKSNITKV